MKVPSPKKAHREHTSIWRAADIRVHQGTVSRRDEAMPPRVCSNGGDGRHRPLARARDARLARARGRETVQPLRETPSVSEEVRRPPGR